MPLADRLSPPTSSGGYTCPDYDPVPGGKRCRSYLDGGACALPTEFMCVEWLRANGQPVPAPRTPAAPVGRPLPMAPAAPTAARRAPAQRRACDTPDPVILRRLTDDDVSAFKARGVEVCVSTDELGDLWLVPDYTGAERKELSIHDAATLAAVCIAFPGARVVQLERRDPTST